MKPSQETTNGIFLYSLCQRCNNQTGQRYGADYSSFVRILAPNATPDNADKSLSISLSGLNPLRILKQATSMMLSTSNPTDFRDHQRVGAPGRSNNSLSGTASPSLSKDDQRRIFEELRLFVKRRDSNDFPRGVRVYLFAGVGRPIGFATGVFARADLDTRTSFVAVATGLFPLHWVFTLEGEFNEPILEVTNWAGYGYKQELDGNIDIPFKWFVGYTPLDFRSPQDVNTWHFINSMKFEGFVPSTDVDGQTLLDEATYFAKVLGKTNAKGYNITAFEDGVFYDFDGLTGWLRNGSSNDAVMVLEARLAARENNG